MERRALLKCLVGLVAAPAIIKVAGIMPVKASLQPRNSLLTINQITGESVRLWTESNKFLLDLDEQYAADFRFASGAQWENSPGFVERVNRAYDEQFGSQGAKIGDTLRIRLPSDYTITGGLGISLQDTAEQHAYLVLQDGFHNKLQPDIPDSLALAAAAVAIAPTVLKTPVTRRFWAKAA